MKIKPGKELVSILNFFLGNLLLVYALVSPVRLSTYFYPKPLPDLLVDGLLLLAFVLIAFKWLKKGTGWLSMTIPLLAFSWLSIDFILYSKSDAYYAISYAYIAWWGVCWTALWKLSGQRSVSGRPAFALISILMGCAWGYFVGIFWPLMVVTVIFLLSCFSTIDRKRRSLELSLSIVVGLASVLLSLFLPKPIFFESQSKFHDKVVYSHQTRFQQIDVTEWKGNYWFYQDQINQFSSIDSWLFYEPFAHPAMQLAPESAKVLIIGGENGMLLKELKAYKQVSIDLLPVDAEYLEISRSNPLFTTQNGGVFNKVNMHVVNMEAFSFLNSSPEQYDVIFVDVPDPVDLELNQYFTLEFYELCQKALNQEGILVTQSGSPYFATAAFQSIGNTMKEAGFTVQSYHNQILTLGEWAWTIGSKEERDLPEILSKISFEKVNTEWLNTEAMQMMLSFGKPYVTSAKVEINTIREPVIYQYYNRGNYQLN